MNTTVDTFLHLNQQFDHAFNHQQAAAIGALYAPNARVMPAPAGEVVQGRSAITDFFAGLLHAGVIEHALDMQQAIITDRLATQVGRWSAAMLAEDGTKQQFGGNVQLVFERQPDGQWLAVTHIWN